MKDAPQQHPPTHTEARQTSRSAPRIVPALIVLVAGTGLSGGLFALQSRTEQTHLRENFHRWSDTQRAVIQSTLDRHVQSIASVGQLFDASVDVSHAEFLQFTGGLFAHEPGLRGVHWIRRTAGANPDEAGQLPLARKPRYTATGGNGDAQSAALNLAAHPALSSAAARSLMQSQIVASGPLNLPTADSHRTTGFVVLRPVYERATPAPDELTGVVVGEIAVKPLVHALMPLATADQMHVALYDDNAVDGRTLVFRTGSGAQRGRRAAVESASAYTVRHTLQLPGREWQLVAMPTEQYIAGHLTWTPWLLLGSGLLATALLSSYLFTGSRKTARLRRLADDLARSNHELHVARDDREHAEQAWRDAFDAVKDPIFLHDREGRIIRANRAYADAAARPFRDIIGSLYWEIFPPGDGPLPGCQAALNGEHSEWDRVTTEAGNTTYRSRAYALYEDQGQYRYSIHIMEDITAEQRARTALEESERTLRNLFASLPGMVYRCLNDADWTMQLVSDASVNLTGYSADELINNATVAYAELIHPDDRERVNHEVDTAIAEGRSFELEYRIRRKDGQQRWVWERGKGIFDDTGTLRFLEGVINDVTARKLALEALSQSEQRYERLFHSMLDGFALHELITDDEGRPVDYRFLEVNPAFEHMTGLKSSEVVGNTAREVLPTLESEWIDVYGEVALTGESTRFDQYVAALERYFEVVAYRPESEKFATVFRDVTQERRSDLAVQRLNRALLTIRECNQALVRAPDEQTLLNDVCRILVERGGYRLAWVGYARDDPDKTVEPVAASGFNGSHGRAIPIRQGAESYGGGSVGQAVRTGKTQVIPDTRGDAALAPWLNALRAEELASAVALPLPGEHQVMGVLSVYGATADAFVEEEIDLLEEMAGDLAYGIRMLRTTGERDQARQALDAVLLQTIQAISVTVEKRDPYTAGHQQRVGELAAAIAREMGLASDHIEGIRLGSLIHDIGKIYVPAEILTRPGRLSDNEMAIIKTHPQVGHDIVQSIEFPWPVKEMILQHHERLDGSGYPQGLKRGEIIRDARILAVADVVEAIYAHRPYRPGRGIDHALTEIQNGRDHIYDAEAVDACFNVFERKDFQWATH